MAMNYVFRCYVEKKPGFDVEAQKVFHELRDQLGIQGLTGLRLLNRYDAEGLDYPVYPVSYTHLDVYKRQQQFNVDNLSDPENTTLLHHINQAIKARGVMRRDIDYVVKDGEVIIVDEFTGRLMYGRRYNEGLHQAIEAKEHVTVARESKTLATITFQNYFRLYDKLSGMTGTAMTEEEEFGTI